MRAIIRQSPEVRVVSSQSGRVDSGTDPFGPNRNELFVGLTPIPPGREGKDKQQLVEELSAKTAGPDSGGRFSTSPSRSSIW